uniref:Protein kinase domain-containing protein n=1 Tax=Parastrongyloides trichosuri TaxID=131310 RepID=A0A0N4Z626_PARTI
MAEQDKPLSYRARVKKGQNRIVPEEEKSLKDITAIDDEEGNIIRDKEVESTLMDPKESMELTPESGDSPYVNMNEIDDANKLDEYNQMVEEAQLEKEINEKRTKALSDAKKKDNNKDRNGKKKKDPTTMAGNIVKGVNKISNDNKKPALKKGTFEVIIDRKSDKKVNVKENNKETKKNDEYKSVFINSKIEKPCDIKEILIEKKDHDKKLKHVKAESVPLKKDSTKKTTPKDIEDNNLLKKTKTVDIKRKSSDSNTKEKNNVAKNNIDKTINLKDSCEFMNNVKETKKVITPKKEDSKHITQELSANTILGGRFKILNKIGSGGCGYVYKSFDIIKNMHVAVKAENNKKDGGSVLKFEVKVLQNLSNRKNIVQLIAYGKKETFSWMALTLLGYNIYDLRVQCDEFTLSTIARIGIQALYGLKEIHEAGFIHRDVKPQNMAIGGRNINMKIIYLLDFGLSREFVLYNTGVPVIREPRINVLFRGTSRYCSKNAQQNREQGRSDDLWSLMYVLAELVQPLPWSKFGKNRKEVLKCKENTATRDLFPNYPEMEILSDYLETLTYHSKPKYGMIYQVFNNMLLITGGQMSDLYDWEIQGVVKVPEAYEAVTNIVKAKTRIRAKSNPPKLSDKNSPEEPSKSRTKSLGKNEYAFLALKELNDFYVYETFASSKCRF